MAMRILWPNLPAHLIPVATEAVGSGFETEFREKFEDVTNEQWANADAIVGACPPQYIDKLRNCRVFVKYGVGYDDVDIERFGKLGIPVCNVPDYGTREVADHAIALMMTLAKSVAYHDQELRADLVILNIMWRRVLTIIWRKGGGNRQPRYGVAACLRCHDRAPRPSHQSFCHSS